MGQGVEKDSYELRVTRYEFIGKSLNPGTLGKSGLRENELRIRGDKLQHGSTKKVVTLAPLLSRLAVINSSRYALTAMRYAAFAILHFAIFNLQYIIWILSYPLPLSRLATCGIQVVSYE